MIRLACALILGLVALVPARADELDDFNTAVETFAAHSRAAQSYVRVRDADRVGAELGAMREAFGAIAEKFGTERPAPYRDNAQFGTLMVDIPVQLVGADMILSMGRGDRVTAILVGIRRSLSNLRRASNAQVLADCILDADDAVTALSAARETVLNLADAKASAVLTAKLVAYGETLKRCDAMAPEPIRSRPTFRRNLDGAMAASLALQDALARADAGAFANGLDALRSFAEELSWHFG